MSELTPSQLPEAVLRAALQQWRQGGRAYTLPVVGRSMWPLLRDGDSVAVETGSVVFAPGDIIVFRQAERWLVHRVLCIQGEGAEADLLTKGDFRRVCDGWVSAENVLGRVVARQRRGRSARLDTRPLRWIGRLLAATFRLVAARPPSRLTSAK